MTPSHSQDGNGSYRLFATKTILNYGNDDEVECIGYKKDRLKSLFTHIVSILLVGIPYLIGYWKPAWKVKWHRSVSPLFNADTVLLREKTLGDAQIVPISIKHVSEHFIPRYIHKSDLNCDSSSSGGSTEASSLSSSEDTSPLWHPSKLTLRYFVHHHSKYVWDSKKKTYVRLYGLDRDTQLNMFSADLSRGLTRDMQMVRQMLYGPNSIEVEVKPYLKLLFEEVLNPFYIFQIASMILWSLDNYYYYASCILFISVVSVVVSLLETRRQSQSLHDMVASSNELMATVYRGQDIFEDLQSTELVPGDVIAIPSSGCVMSCDAVLVAGTCIVNESMLTGESVPVTKSSIPMTDINDEENEEYDPERHKRHTLFSGTAVIQTRYYGQSHVLAVVVRTGFDTAKGALIRSILYPRPMGFKFYRDSIRFICVLFSVATVGMGYCIYVYIRRGSDATMILLRSLDIITIVVPPALPAAMTVGTYYAQSRLKKSKIFCISPQRINICGKLKLVCFDKTGTLTEDGLDMYGVQTTNMSWRQLECNTSATDEINEFHENIEKDVASLPFKSPVMTCLAACHSLTLIDNQLTGDPLDVKMFEATGWSLEEEGQDTSKFDMLMPSVVRPPREALRRHKSVASLSSTNSANTGTTADPNLTSLLDPDHYPHEVGIIRQFTFSSSVARMSVITRALGDNHFHVFTKGAPEKMEDLCLPHTLPPDFHDNLKTLTLKGYRVIGLAHRRLPLEINWLKAQKMKRDQAEKNLVFLGFLIMQNTLKPETTPVIEELIAANIRCVMVTGDNLLTAVSVARDCQMVPVHHKVLIVEASIEEDEELLQPASIRFVTTEDSPNIEPHDYVEEANGVTELANLSSLEAGQIMKHNYHFAMSGKSWGVLRVHFPHLLYKIIQRGTVFARMSPEQKAQLVEEYQAIDYVVSMCGDGANDCGALKAAHVGISLSEAEASVAAPFTSRVADITCVPTVIREGRCALVTSFGVFKYMALYSMVQFISVLLLYTLLTNLGDAQFLYIDLVITTTVAVLMGWTKAYDKLVPQRPPGSLVSGPNMVSIFSQILVTMAIQVGAYLYLKQQSWYEPLHPATPETEIILCWETTAIFYVSSFQYLILAAVFSKGKPYRQPFYTNIPFFTALVVLAAFTVLITLYPGPTLANFLELMYNYGHPTTHLKFRLLLIGLAGLNLVLCIFIEKAIVERRWLKTVVHILMRKTRPKNKFKIIQREMDEQGWPNVSPMHLS